VDAPARNDVRNGTALDQSLGGVLIAGLSWWAIFLVNVPMGCLTFVVAHGIATCPLIGRAED